MKLNYGKTFLLGFGFLGVSVIWSVYNVYVPIFLDRKFGLDPVWIGFFMTLDNIAALLIQPPVGAWSDKLRTPIGRRMPFLLIGAPIGAIAFGIIPLAQVLPLFVACTSSLLLSMALWRTPVVALMPDITPSQFRSQANGVINLMGGVGTIVATLGGSALYEMNPAYPFWLGSVLVVAATLLVFFLLKEPKVFEASEAQPGMIESLRSVVQDEDKSGLRLLLAIFFWFLGFAAIEAFFSLYAINHLGLGESDGGRLIGHLGLIFVLFAMPAGYLGGRIGRRPTILAGIVLMSAAMLAIFFTPAGTLTIPLTPKLPALGVIPVISIFMMTAGAAWALININSLPMVVDMTDASRVGTYTGLYYLFSTLSAIAGPNVNGWIIKLTGNNYNAIMIVAPIFMVVALVLMVGVRSGEAVVVAPAAAGD
ncbi:MAG: SLC45 family MFS transporter [Chloroflexi bacterium]|nr:SLC45 family MFS transporter [Chloroflexota bacterium]